MVLRTHLMIVLARSHAVTHFRAALFIAVMTSFTAFFATAVFPVFIAAFAVLHAVHIEEGDFFKVQLAFVLADGLGGSGAGLFFIDEADAFLFGLGWVISAMAATCSSWRAMCRWWR